MEERPRVLITSALPYVNNEPHLGNLIGCVLSADVYARYRRLQGDRVHYLCGTDEYGTTTELKAYQEKVSCEELCARYRKLHQEIYAYMNISFDYFGKTSTDSQTQITHQIFRALWEKGLIETREITQLYDEKAEQFLPDRYVRGYCYHELCRGKEVTTNGDQCDTCGQLIDPVLLEEPYSTVTCTTPVPRKTKHLFLKLGAVQEKIQAYVLESGQVKLTKTAREITLSWLNQELVDRCITRDLKWGTPVPELEGLDPEYLKKVFYVWFDAPIGYLSILQESGQKLEDWVDSEWVQFMAKDNVPFHTVLFPGTLLGSELALPKVTGISATEFLTYQGGKFSKSQNRGVFGSHLQQIDEILGTEADYWRCYLIKIRPQTSDSSFEWEGFMNFVNNELIANLGNFINRIWSFLVKYPELRELEGEIDLESQKLLTEVEARYAQYEAEMKEYQLREAFQQIFTITSLGNQYLQHRKLWEQLKSEDLRGAHSTVLAGIWIWRLVGGLLSPFAPEKAEELIQRVLVLREGNKIGFQSQHHSKFLLFQKLKWEMIQTALLDTGLIKKASDSESSRESE